MPAPHPAATARLTLRPTLVGLLALVALLVVLATGCNVRSMGANVSGQLGDGTREERSTPVVASVITFDQVSAGASHSCGVSDGALYCWGNGGRSRLGVGDDVSRSEPTRVGTADDWTAVSAGGAHTCGIRAGAVLCWGSNEHKQVTPHRPSDALRSPTIVVDRGDDDPPRTVSAGVDHSCATFASGRLHCWGQNDDGQLGTGDTTEFGFVREIGTDYASVSAGGHSCAISTGGELRCWGPGTKGQLGNGDLDRHLEPTPVAGTARWAEVDTGLRHTCARAVDRTAWCWGDGTDGRLGTGTEQLSPVPVAVAPSARWVAISTGSAHTCGVRTDQRVLCWGANARHQLGDGTRTRRLVPTAMAGDLAALAVSAGGEHTHVVLAPES